MDGCQNLLPLSPWPACAAGCGLATPNATGDLLTPSSGTRANACRGTGLSLSMSVIFVLIKNNPARRILVTGTSSYLVVPLHRGQKSRLKNNPTTMKKLLTLLAIVTGLAVMAPADSQARDHRSYGRSYWHNCGACNTPLYRERTVIGRDRFGRPVLGWRTVGHNCRPPHRHHQHRHHHHHHHGRGGPIGFPFPGFGRF